MERKEILAVMWLTLLWLCADPARGQTPATSGAQPIVTGRLVDEDGKGIAGVAVGAFPWSTMIETKDLLAKPPFVTDKHGAYRVPVDPNQSGVIIHIAAPGRQCLTLPLGQRQRTRGGSLGETLMPVGSQLIGRIRNESGKPLAGVTIRVTSAIDVPWTTRASIRATATSNDKGIFRVVGVPRTGLKLTASKLGFGAVQQIVAQSSALSLTMRERGLVRGTVRDVDGKPIAGIAVYLVMAVTVPAESRTVKTGPDGTFVITAPPKNVRYRIKATQRTAPYRILQSELLRGAQQDVAVIPRSQTEPVATFQLKVVDAASRQPVPKFTVTSVQASPENLEEALRQAGTGESHKNGEAVLHLHQFAASFLVRAQGHAFQLVAPPDDPSQPLLMKLTPEAALVGTVTDPNGKPIAGARVRALPRGNVSSTGSTIEDPWPITDKLGRYRIGGLQAGEYGVQAHAPDRRAKAPKFATAVVGKDIQCNLGVPNRNDARLYFTGTLPDGPHRQLEADYFTTHGPIQKGDHQHYVVPPAPVPLSTTEPITFGPLPNNEFRPNIYVPSRTRAGTGTHIRLAKIDYTEENVIELPDLTSTIVKGRLEPSSAIPFERIAVIATLSGSRGDFSSSVFRPPCVAGVLGNGTFRIDLPAGSYCYQLCDVLTGIVFYTHPVDLPASNEVLTLRPTIRWLDVAFEPEDEGGELIVSHIEIQLQRPRKGSVGAFLAGGSRTNDLETSGASLFFGATKMRWLVPAGEIGIAPRQSFDSLRITPPNSTIVISNGDTTSVLIDTPNQRVTLRMPAPPSDEELSKL